MNTSGMITSGLEAYISDTNKATSIDTLFALFAREMERLGYDRILMALMTDHPELKKEAEHGILKSYPEDWVKHYLQQGYDCIDPIRSSAFIRSGVFTWQEVIEQNQLSKKQQRMFSEAREAGLYSGVGVSLRGNNGAVAAVGAANSVAEFAADTNQLAVVNLLSQQFYSCFWRLLRKLPHEQPVSLSEKEQEVLKWCARGYTKAEIGSKLTISSHTVDYHIRNTLRKLQARNMTAAVVQALNRGLIQI